MSQNTVISLEQIDVIAPNLKRRLSGVTATIARLVPVQAKKINIVTVGPGLPPQVPKISLWRLLFLPRGRRRIWHARRNTEMILGLVLRKLLRLNLAIIFTSASQRNHTRFSKRLINSMDMVIATSAKSAGYLDRPAKVVMHGIDVQAFRPSENIQSLRASCGLPDGFLVGCFGRIRHQKGTDVFVSAMIELMPKYPQLIGIVLGRATKEHSVYLEGLQAQVASAGLSERLLFMPEAPVDQMAEWYQTLDIFVAPQRWEGFGLTPLEAMACGVPVIAGRVGAFEEQIVDGQTGLIITEGKVDELCGAVERLISAPSSLREMRIAARQLVISRFRIEAESDALISVYRELLES